MKSELKTYTITIAGQSYSITSDEDKTLLEKAAHKVESTMAAIAQAAPKTTPEKQALLAALQIAHQACKQESEAFGMQIAVDGILKALGRLEQLD
jgi:cell division protein ZapA (FtsZ GTPase activity inhibitor)